VLTEQSQGRQACDRTTVSKPGRLRAREKKSARNGRTNLLESKMGKGHKGNPEGRWGISDKKKAAENDSSESTRRGKTITGERNPGKDRRWQMFEENYVKGGNKQAG